MRYWTLGLDVLAFSPIRWPVGCGAFVRQTVGEIVDAHHGGRRSGKRLFGRGLEPPPGLLQVKRLKAFGEPAVDLGQSLTGLVPLALLLPQPAQAQRRPQLQGLGLLATGHLEGLMETGCRLENIWERELEEQLPLEPI